VYKNIEQNTMKTAFV